jgi:hypothetical protein
MSCVSLGEPTIILVISMKMKVEDTGFKLWHTGNTSIKNGVGIVLDKSLKDGVVDIKRQGHMIILVKLLIGDLIFNVISAYVI